jgi:hypothetical protein
LNRFCVWGALLACSTRKLQEGASHGRDWVAISHIIAAVLRGPLISLPSMAEVLTVLAALEQAETS